VINIQFKNKKLVDSTGKIQFRRTINALTLTGTKIHISVKHISVKQKCLPKKFKTLVNQSHRNIL